MKVTAGLEDTSKQCSAAAPQDRRVRLPGISELNTPQTVFRHPFNAKESLTLHKLHWLWIREAEPFPRKKERCTWMHSSPCRLSIPALKSH